ncbi:probable G-protein coupled receptor Mth-like 1 [Orussus abietinus]|uniref:probable G-protein coupled receptor Mth-like 1 n=1 Tax=Orussus abietinus TaxID=222816 RepID=UPI000C715DBA|nr:probable G-protein coupled receptor Mth-like 1 [Orussus abietinus]
MARTRVLALLGPLALALSSASTPDSRVSVLKCCPNGSELSNPEGAEGPPRCVPSTGPWRPLIYSPSRQGMLSEPPPNWRVIENSRPNCSPSTVLTYIPNRSYNPFFLLEVGSAVLDVSGSGNSFEPGEFCADGNALLVCAAKREVGQAAATARPRVHRCCGDGAAFHEERNTCVNLKEEPDAPALLPNASFVEIVPGFPPCPKSDNFTILAGTEDAILKEDGGLEVAGVKLPPGQFCVERIKEIGSAKVFACSVHAPQRKVVQPESDIRFTLYPVGFIISVVFLAATLAAGWLLPASHHVLHWRCQTHHVACLMLGDLLMAIIQLARDSLQGEVCKIFAIMAHFFFLAAFFWLNTMCFNIWWTFRDLRPASLEKGQETLRLRIYACYAWGGPLLVAGIAALLDHLPTQPEYARLRPRFGEKQCWFYGDMEILAYFFGPIGALLAVNLLFFAATARELTCGLWKGEFVKSTTER